jgi:hypothetical protein
MRGSARWRARLGNRRRGSDAALEARGPDLAIPEEVWQKGANFGAR